VGVPHQPACLRSSQCLDICCSCSWQYFLPSFAPLGWVLLLAAASSSLHLNSSSSSSSRSSRASPVRGRSWRWRQRRQNSISGELFGGKVGFFFRLGLLVATTNSGPFLLLDFGPCCEVGVICRASLSDRRFRFRFLQ
jgi:hypothetical protein